MRLFKKKTKAIETKGGGISPASNHRQAFVNFLTANREHDLAAAQAVAYYNKSSPLSTAINWIITSAAAIEIFLYDKLKKVYIDQHPALDLLNNPNPAYSYDYLFQSLVAYYLITGNGYLMAAGDGKRPPVSLFCIPAQEVSPQVNSTDGYIQYYRMSNQTGTINFNREIKNQKFRFISAQGELYAIKTINLKADKFAIIGQSPLNALFYDIEQSIAGNVHNLSLLKRGTNVGGVFTSETTLTQDAYDRLRSMIDLYYTGESNAGRPYLVEGGLEYTPNSQSNKDMDFVTLKQGVEQAIFKAYKLPLPLLIAETMTMANMDAARLDLYRNAVLPVTDRIYAELTRFLLPYYGEASANLEFRYQESHISALKPEIFANAESLKATGVITKNEIRNSLGYNSMATGGDELYEPASNVPDATN